MQDSVCLSLVAGYPAKRKYKAVRGRMPNRGLASGKSCHRHSQGRMGQAARSWFKCQDAAMGKLPKCGSTGWNAGIWLYWSFLQKMLVLMTKSDSSTFSSRLFVSQCNDQFQSRSWGQPGLEMNLTGHDPTLWYHCGVMIQCNAGWHQLHKSTSSYLLRSSKASGLWSLPFMFLSGGWSITTSLAFLRNEQQRDWGGRAV